MDEDELSRRIEEMAAASRNRRGYALSSDELTQKIKEIADRRVGPKLSYEELTQRIKEIARRGGSSEYRDTDNEEK
jgi:hypothetical protein